MTFDIDDCVGEAIDKCERDVSITSFLSARNINTSTNIFDGFQILALNESDTRAFCAFLAPFETCMQQQDLDCKFLERQLYDGTAAALHFWCDDSLTGSS